LKRTRVLQWMCFEQYNHEPNIATSRYWLKHLEIDPARQIQLDGKRPAGYVTLDVIEDHLSDR